MEAKLDRQRKSCSVGGVREENSYFESKVFLVDNFLGHNRAWQEIANIVNSGNSVKRYIKEIHKKWDNICSPQKLRFLYIVGAKDKQVIDNLYINKSNIIVESSKTEQQFFDTGIHNSQAAFKARQLQRLIQRGYKYPVSL